MVKPGDGANIGGRSITTVSSPSGVVKSTTLSVPEFSSLSNCDKTLELMISPFFVCKLSRPYCDQQSRRPVKFGNAQILPVLERCDELSHPRGMLRPPGRQRQQIIDDIDAARCEQV